MSITPKAACDNPRATFLLIATFATILIAILVMAFCHVDGNSALGGALLLLMGKFIGNIGTAFDYEFGSSRSDQAKDLTIAAATKGPIVTATVDTTGTQVVAQPAPAAHV